MTTLKLYGASPGLPSMHIPLLVVSLNAPTTVNALRSLVQFVLYT